MYATIRQWWQNPIAKILFGLIALYLFFSIVGYFGMVSARNNYDNKVGDVQNAYQFRFDTTPNFVKTAMFSVESQNRITLENARIREQLGAALKSGNINLADQTAGEYRSLLINVRSEAVASLNVTQLTELNSEIDSVERVIRHQRDQMNKACRDYRNSVQRPPGILSHG